MGILIGSGLWVIGVVMVYGYINWFWFMGNWCGYGLWVICSGLWVIGSGLWVIGVVLVYGYINWFWFMGNWCGYGLSVKLQHQLWLNKPQCHD